MGKVSQILDRLESELQSLKDSSPAKPGKDSFMACVEPYTTDEGRRTARVRRGTDIRTPYDSPYPASESFRVTQSTGVGRAIWGALKRLDSYRKEIPNPDNGRYFAHMDDDLRNNGRFEADLWWYNGWKKLPLDKQVKSRLALPCKLVDLDLQSALKVGQGAFLMHKEECDTEKLPMIVRVSDTPIISTVSDELIRLHVVRPTDVSINNKTGYILEDHLHKWWIVQRIVA